MRMKIDYISDLHMGFVIGNKRNSQEKVRRKVSDYVLSTLPDGLGDVLVLAGDVDEYNTNVLYTLEEYAKVYPKVFYVFGNHDLYLMSQNQRNKYKNKSRNRQEELKEMVNESIYSHKITVLDNTVEEYLGVTFAGTMLWYTLPLEFDKVWWKENSNDSRKIYPTFIDYSEERHQEDLEFYQSLESVNVDVLITHVPPIHMNDKHRPSASYHNVAISQLGLYARHWVCGHQHVRTVKKVNDTLIYNNSAGYVGEFKELPKVNSFEV